MYYNAIAASIDVCVCVCVCVYDARLGALTLCSGCSSCCCCCCCSCCYCAIDRFLCGKHDNSFISSLRRWSNVGPPAYKTSLNGTAHDDVRVETVRYNPTDRLSRRRRRCRSFMLSLQSAMHCRTNHPTALCVWPN